MTDAESVEDVKRALLRDIDAGKVFGDGLGGVYLGLGSEGAADVTSGAWGLQGEGLAEPNQVLNNGAGNWRLTVAGRAYLKAGDGDGVVCGEPSCPDYGSTDMGEGTCPAEHAQPKPRAGDDDG